MKRIAVIMAGGYGVRLWPQSTSSNPKQFASQLGFEQMIKYTYNNLLSIYDKNSIFVSTLCEMKSAVMTSLPEINEEMIICEPLARNTAHSIEFANVCLHRKLKDDFVYTVFPCDHYLRNLDNFKKSVQLAISTAELTDKIIAIGVEPTRPATQLGYLQVNHNQIENSQISEVLVFAEKPDYSTARRFVETGDFLWNTGIYTMKSSVFHSEYDKYLPQESLLMKKLLTAQDNEDWLEKAEFALRQFHSISVDYAIMEKSNNLLVVCGDFRWSDIGTWDEIYRLSNKDSNNNVKSNNTLVINSSNCMVKSSEKLIALVGVDDIYVIEGKEAILVVNRGFSENVKEIINHLRRNDMTQYL